MSTPIPEKVDLSKYVGTRLMGNRPHLRGRRLPVSTIVVSAASNGWNIPEIAYEFTITEEQVLAALLYYREHKTEIDAQDSEEQQLWDETYRLHSEESDEA
jgi:uncharacterized protein (DUF433 family)